MRLVIRSQHRYHQAVLARRRARWDPDPHLVHAPIAPTPATEIVLAWADLVVLFAHHATVRPDDLPERSQIFLGDIVRQPVNQILRNCPGRSASCSTDTPSS